MSELMNARNGEGDFRWRLLTTVSALALLAAVSSESKAADQDVDRPTVWIELGSDLEHAEGQGDSFVPGFLAVNPNSPVLTPVSPVQAQNPPPFSFAEDGKISIQPEDSNWVFSASVNYGRSSNFRHVDHQTNKAHYGALKSGAPESGESPLSTYDFADTQAHHRESHAVVDFSAGKDVGLGLFGRDNSSTLSLGVRFAQFASKATFDVRARPDLQLHAIRLPTFHFTKYQEYFHTYHAAGQASRSFHGIGPSISWNSSAPLVGNPQNGEVTFDWGADAALLFGRQKTRVLHHESGHYVPPSLCTGCRSVAYLQPVYQRSGGHSNIRSVVVPNVGGFAGASWRVQNFKASLGYRADFFFGAIDGGIDTRKSETLGFYGPFASVSIGLGG